MFFLVCFLNSGRSDWDSSWRRGRSPTHVRVQKLDKRLWMIVVVAVTFKTQPFSKGVVCSWAKEVQPLFHGQSIENVLHVVPFIVASVDVGLHSSNQSGELHIGSVLHAIHTFKTMQLHL